MSFAVIESSELNVFVDGAKMYKVIFKLFIVTSKYYK